MAEIRSEDRLMAALCHASILVPTTGLIVPMVIWATQKDKSEFVRFQALQAAAFHLAWTIVNTIGALLYVLSFFGAMVPMLFVGFVSSDTAAILVGLGVMLPVVSICLLLLLSVGGMCYGLLAALLTGLGRPFRYPLLGRWVAQMLAPPQASAVS